MIKPPLSQPTRYLIENPGGDPANNRADHVAGVDGMKAHAQSAAPLQAASAIQTATFFAARRSPRAKGRLECLIAPPQRDVAGINCKGALRFVPDSAPTERLMPPARAIEASLLGTSHYRCTLQKNEHRGRERYYTLVDDLVAKYKR